MTRQLTPEQAHAVTQREGPMLLSANAGSGKTTVLVERFVLAVIEDGLDPARLLAITFTDKAAGELRSRVRARLVALGRPDAARDLEGAWIGTIHGFCTRVLRAHAVAAGLDPRFEVLDEAATRALEARAFEEALAAFLTQGAAALDLAAGYGVDRLQEAITGVHATLRSQGATDPRLPPARPRHEVDAARTAVRAAAEALRAELATVTRQLKSLDKARETLGDCFAALDLAQELTTAPWKLPGGKTPELNTPACGAFTAAVTALQQALTDREALAAHALLDGLLQDHAAGYAAAKAARSGVDFEDLELRTRDLFDAAPAVAQGYAERFDRVMLDEFQDTNRLQLELLEHLDRGNAFLVGDELQSIYGFRHADVEVFRAKRREHRARGQAPVLATNWRSDPAILATINGAWGSEVHGGGFVPLVAGLQPTALAEPAVELLLTTDGWDDDVEGRLADELADGMPQGAKLSKLAEARAIARRVRTLVDGGACTAQDVVVLVRAATDLGVFERALEREGLATLAAGGRGYWLRQPVQDLTSYLAALANPRDELALYGTLASPLCGLSSDGLAHVAAVARERARAAAATRTTEVRHVDSAMRGERASGSRPAAAAAVWPALRDPRLLARLSAADGASLTAFLARFTHERAGRDRHALDELLERAVTQSGYDLHVLRLPGGRRRLANVHKLLRLAAQFEAGHGRDVRGFIDHATAEVEADAREAEAPVELGDQAAVRLMTVHAAKGLEFGVVVVADLGRGRQNRRPDLLVDGDRVGIRLVRLGASSLKALDFDALAAEAVAREQEEERRILHVAFTRAERRLILSGVAPVGPDAEWPKASTTAAPLAWIGPRIDPALPARLAAEPVLTVDHAQPGGRVHVAAQLVAPDTAPQTLGLAAPAAPGAQLGFFAAEGGDVTAAPADDPVAELFEAGLTATLTDPAAGLDVPAHRVAAAARAWLDAVGASAPAGDRPGAVPSGPLSYTQLSLHQRCGYRWYLERGLKLPSSAAGAPVPAIPPPLGPVLDPRVRGQLAHLVLEELDPRDPRAPSAEELQELAEGKDVELAQDDARELHGLLAHFVASSPLLPRLAEAVRLRTEASFAFALPDGHLVQGVLDVLATEPDGTVLVVDWKTDRLHGGDPAQLTEDHYAIQRRLYALAALATHAPRVEVAYAYLERPEPLTWGFTQEDRSALAQQVAEVSAPLLQGHHPVAAEPHLGLCAGCPGRGGLCSHPLDMTDRVLERAWPPLPGREALPAGSA